MHWLRRELDPASRDTQPGRERRRSSRHLNGGGVCLACLLLMSNCTVIYLMAISYRAQKTDAPKLVTYFVFTLCIVHIKKTDRGLDSELRLRKKARRSKASLQFALSSRANCKNSKDRLTLASRSALAQRSREELVPVLSLFVWPVPWWRVDASAARLDVDSAPRRESRTPSGAVCVRASECECVSPCRSRVV